MSKNTSTAIVWFRHDLRIEDNQALAAACEKYARIIPLYILDEKNNILGEAQAWWLHHSLLALNKSLTKKLNLKLILKKGEPLEIFLQLIKHINIDAIYWNRGYTPSRIETDKIIKAGLKEINRHLLTPESSQQITSTARLREIALDVKSFKANLFNEPWSILNKNGEFFKVFTPYWKACRQTLKSEPLTTFKNNPIPVEVISDNLDDWQLLPKLPWANDFKNFWKPGEEGAKERLKNFITSFLQGYKTQRDIPGITATSRLSPHLHFGEISPNYIFREVELAMLVPDCDLVSAERFLAELGWREFSYYLLYHFPELPYKNFKAEFDRFPWHNDAFLLKKWQKGLTGFPIVDAGMRELWASGYMHNRVRMIVASFLTKGLFIDWRIGADWFLHTLLDADLANNSASWQWVAGCGADAAPYFRIFNPVLQSEKFDPDGIYIRRWVKELASVNNADIHAPWASTNAIAIYKTTNYPRPIINHNDARAKALEYYQQLKT